MKRFLSTILSLSLATSLVVSSAAAAKTVTYSDTNGHWAEKSIERWSSYGVIQGSDGAFRPNDSLTRAEMATILVNLLGLEDTAYNSYADLNGGEWYADEILKCTAAGIMYGDGTNCNAKATISRQESFVMIARALGITPDAIPDLGKFADQSSVSNWAAGYVSALVSAGIVNGATANTLAPLIDINRASTITILDNAITTYANEPGASVQATGTGITLVAAPNVTVTGAADTLLVTPGASGGTVTLQDASVASAAVTAPNATLAIAGASTVNSAVLSESAVSSKMTVEKDAAVGSIIAAAPMSTIAVSGKVASVNTTATAGAATVDVAENATVGEISVAGASTEIAVAGEVEKVTIADTATNTDVEAAKGSVISSVDISAAGTSISGSGKVESVTTSGNNTTVSTIGTKVDVAKGTTGTTAGGKDVDGGDSVTTKPSTPSGGSSGSSSGNKDNHSHRYKAVVTKEPTCTEEGETTYKCSCGKISGTEVIKALGHAYGEGVVTKEATCIEAGVKTFTCARCGDIKTEAIDALGHSYDNCVCTVCGDRTAEVIATEGAWDALSEKLAEITGHGDDALVEATYKGSEYALTLNVDAIQSGSQAVGDDMLNGLVTKLKNALDESFGDYTLTVDGHKVYVEGDFQNTALKNALFSVSDGFFYTLSNMEPVDGVYTYKTVKATVEGDCTYKFTLAVQLKGDDVAKVQSLAKTLADHLAMEKLSASKIEARYGISVDEAEAIVVTVEMPDALMQKATEMVAVSTQDRFDETKVGTFLNIMSGLEIQDMVGSHASSLESVLTTVNSNANAVNKVLSKLDVTVTAKDGNAAAFNMKFVPGTDGSAWENFMAGVMGMTKGDINDMTPGQFKVTDGSYNDGTYYAVPVTVEIDLDAADFQATETVVVVLHVDFSAYAAN